jgi:hypothetical protein
MTHTSHPASLARSTATRTEPALWTRLPSGGWQVRFWVDTDERTLIDIVGPDCTLAYRLANTHQAAPSINAGWTRCASGRAGDTQSWALAVGHVPAGLGHVVSFARPMPKAHGHRMTLPPQAPSGLWAVHDGLWAAAASGYYTHVRLTAQSATYLYPLIPVTEERADRPLCLA